MKAEPNERLLNWRRLMPFRGVAVFVIVVLVAHISWKMFFHTGIENQEHEKALIEHRTGSVFMELKEKIWMWSGVGAIDKENKDSRYISFLNKDVTNNFVPWSEKTAAVNFWIVNVVCRQTVFLMDYVVRANGERQTSRTILSYDKLHGPSINVVWGCTGVKQLYILFFVILFSRGIWWKRSVYFLAGCLVLLMFNLIRISVVVLFIKHYPGSFELLHDFVFKYLFYGLIFLLWMLWEEKFSGNNLEKK
ncbi:archaeosortase/exosortase family protein [uncultured Bacteroides sp.]|uniref:archaeosortase/exosortase family protein n=1 Tax=uncultured Bacteroides sp. TaxID=162156 RepID=UPI002AABF8EA|nr:archaeosortase/exosortase family protein [uncultured Bacteroides sp.]